MTAAISSTFLLRIRGEKNKGKKYVHPIGNKFAGVSTSLVVIICVGQRAEIKIDRQLSIIRSIKLASKSFRAKECLGVYYVHSREIIIRKPCNTLLCIARNFMYRLGCCFVHETYLYKIHTLKTL